MTQEQFANKILGRFLILEGPGDGPPDEANSRSILDEILRYWRRKREKPAMPVWHANRGMKPHTLNLYAYLKARSDGAIGTGRPPLLGPLPRGERE